MVVATRDGRRAYTTNIPAGTVTRLDLVRGVADRTVEIAPEVEGLALTPDGAELWVGSNAGDAVHVLDAETLASRGVIPAAGVPIRVTITPDGKLALVTNAVGSKLQLVDVARRQVVGVVELPPGAASPPPGQPPSAVPIGTVVSRDSRTAYVSLAARDAVAVIDLASGRVLATLPAGEHPDGIALLEAAAAQR
jgi:DNA-binding beta-propeller fold protein YncE